MPIPNFFLVGAPKCGTTAMDAFLRQHPEVFVPRQKELHFFGSDLAFRVPRITLERYLKCFEGAGERRVVGESSVWYLFSQTAAREIRSFNPDAKILVMIRNPIDVLHSLHSQLLYTGDEDIVDFEEALLAEEDRSQGRRLPKGANVQFAVLYRRIVRFADQIQRYLDEFGRERVFVAVYDDLREAPQGLYASVLRFLGVDASFLPTFETINSNKTARSARLSRLLVDVVYLGKKMQWMPVSSGARERFYGALRKVRGWNTSYVQRQPMAAGTREVLAAELRGEVDRLSELLGRDLSQWLRTASLAGSIHAGCSCEAQARCHP